LNWEAVSAIAEVSAAVAVVVTLLYVSREIRQNSRSLEVSALRDTTAQWNHWSEMIATSPDLADIVAKGNHGLAALSQSESLRYGAWVQSFFDNAESYRSLVNEYRIARDMRVLETIVARRLRIAGFAEWWAANTADYAGDFVDWVESLR
jgi:hypothetical protein